jgi:hypothetical protein
LGNLFAVGPPVFDVQLNGILNVFDRFFVRLALAVATLEHGAGNEKAVSVGFDDNWKSNVFHDKGHYRSTLDHGKTEFGKGCEKGGSTHGRESKAPGAKPAPGAPGHGPRFVELQRQVHHNIIAFALSLSSIHRIGYIWPMNAERLHIIALTLNQELAEQNGIGILQILVNAIQSIVQTSNANTQQNLASALDAFYAAVTDTLSDSFTPAWRQILIEIGGEELFGKNLKQRVEQVMAKNQSTLAVAQQQLGEILSKLQAFKKALDQLVSAFSHFKIGSEKLEPGEAEITLLIPREAVDDKLGEFADELHEMGFILNTFSEVATGHKDDLKIRTVSSSKLMVYLVAAYPLARIVARVIDFIVTQYKKILEIKKLHSEMERLGVPEEISEKTKEHANTRMGEEIDKFTVEIMEEYKTVPHPSGRQHELRNALKISLNRVANRIDKGFNFEVRIEPPKPLPTDAKEADEAKQAVQTIRMATVNMQYMKLEGEPILALSENIESVADGEEKHKRRSTTKKEETK